MVADGDSGQDAALEDVFGLLGNDTRVDVLRALWEAQTADEDPLSFSTLRDRTGVRDSGRFNYHLEKLCPEFVRKRDGGYTLTHAGEQLMGDAVSGTYTAVEERTVAPTTVGDCSVQGCDGRTEVTYRDGNAVFGCDTCDRTPDRTPAPPIIVDAPGHGSLPETASQYSLVLAERTNRGFCHLCDGPVERTVTRLHPEYEPILDGAVDVIHVCEACGNRRRSGSRTVLIGHPAVVSLLYDAGVDYRTTPIWEQTWLTEATERLVDTAPARVVVTVTIDGTEHTFTLDEHLEVVEWE